MKSLSDGKDISCRTTKEIKKDDEFNRVLMRGIYSAEKNRHSLLYVLYMTWALERRLNFAEKRILFSVRSRHTHCQKLFLQL